jgi:hypothetical protein
MNQRQSVRRRLEVLERLPRLQPPPGPLEQIRTLAQQHMSDEDLDLMIHMARDRKRGVSRMLSPSEVEASERHEVALETGAQEMGFKSLADAERRAGGRR